VVIFGPSIKVKECASLLGYCMSIELQTALISAGVATLTAFIAGYISWVQLRRERNKWLVDLKSTYSLELYKSRLVVYPEAFEIIGKLSSFHGSVTTQTAGEVASKLNDWLYSLGGVCAGTPTRGAILGLRESCREWAGEEKVPSDLYAWRNAALSLLRLDLDLHGLESYDFSNLRSLLGQVQDDIRSLEKTLETRTKRLSEARPDLRGRFDY
jgi:hypothetical protein